MKIQKTDNTRCTPYNYPAFKARYKKTDELIGLIDAAAGTPQGLRIGEALDKTAEFFKGVLLEFGRKITDDKSQAVVIKNLNNGNQISTNINGRYKVDTEIYMLESVANPKHELHQKLFGDDSMLLQEIHQEKARLLSKLV